MQPQNPNLTTSFLTAATLIYVFRAGVTAVAATKLALQLVLVKGFILYFKNKELSDSCMFYNLMLKLFFLFLFCPKSINKCS